MPTSVTDGTRSILTLGLLVILASCAVGPNFYRPSGPTVKGYTPEPLAAKTAEANVAGGEAQRFVQGLDIPGQWWTLFHSLTAAVAAERAAAASLDIVRAQLRLGAVGYLALLNAQNTYQQALISLVQARASRYADTAALFQSLGGGWWNRAAVASAAISGKKYIIGLAALVTDDALFAGRAQLDLNTPKHGVCRPGKRSR
jgi:outer membrane protein TolC